MIEDIKEFTNNHLAFLLDKGISTHFRISEHYNEYTIILIFDDVNLNWIDIRDELEPFIKILSIKYKLDEQLIIQDTFGNSVDYKIEELEDINNNYIRSIALWIKK